MPLYPIRMRDGSVEDVYMLMREAPEIGANVRVGNRVGVRIASNAPNQVDKRYEHAALHMRRWDPDAPHHDKDGWCHFTSKAEVREYEAKNPRMKFNAD